MLTLPVVKVRYRYRFYPTTPQAAELALVFGSCRYVWNWALRLRTDRYFNDGVSIGYVASSALLTALKRTPEHAWLNDTSSVPPQQALRHLQTAFVNFFEKRTGYPSFKRKDGKQAAEYSRSAFKWKAGTLSLSGLGCLKVRWSRAFTSAPSTVTIIKDTAGRYFVTLVLDETPERLPPVHRAVGIDLGLTTLATLSTGETIANPRPLVAAQSRLAKAQRDLARKRKGSVRRAVAKLKVAKLHARVVDTRADFLHKVTTDLVRRFDVIAIEDLHVRGMTKNHRLARSLQDASFSTFRRMLEYKCQWYGRELRLVDRFYPSSKRCSQCGYILASLPLACRSWTCPECQTCHDRDLNAAHNILAAGQAVTARGETVRPARKTSRVGTSRRSANHSAKVRVA